jgi:ethanolamine utilization protein EutP (predicted NTPase)
MANIEKPPFFELVETQVTSMGGNVKRGVVTKMELEEAREIRVSIRLPRHIGSTELFTLRNIPPDNYHLLLIAIPRRDVKSNPQT